METKITTQGWLVLTSLTGLGYVFGNITGAVIGFTLFTVLFISYPYKRS